MNKTFNTLLEKYWDFQLKRSPIFATFVGNKQYDDKLHDISEEALEKNIETVTSFLKESEKIDKNQLDEEEQISLKLLQNDLNNEIASHEFKTYRWQVDHIEGEYDALLDLMRILGLKSLDDLKNLKERYRAFPGHIEKYINNLKKGASEGKFASQIAVKRTIDKLSSVIEENLAPYMAFKQQAEKIDNSSQRVEEIEKLVNTEIKNSLIKLSEFLKNEILPHARELPGLKGQAKGDELYRFKIQETITLDISPEQLHEIGLKELEKNHNEIMSIASKQGFKGSIKEYLEKVESDPENNTDDVNYYMEYTKKLFEKAKSKLNLLFSRLPKTECIIKEVEKDQAKNAPAAFYFPPPLDGSRPGIFYTNTYDLKSRHLHIIPALVVHEAVPGHHLQCSFSVELPGLPKFRRYYWSTAFGEGWAHYAELLGKEIGMYESDMAKVGMLFEQAWRAARLVLDTGIHYYGWTREQAIKFMRENVAIGETDATNEIDRYIVWPGQALGYKIGQLEFSNLRKKAEDQLGDKFDIREFHYEILRHGTLPLNILRNKATSWITSFAKS